MPAYSSCHLRSRTLDKMHISCMSGEKEADPLSCTTTAVPTSEWSPNSSLYRATADLDEKPNSSKTSVATHISHSLRGSVDSNPLSLLDLSLTPDLETHAECVAREPITHTRTGATATSIGSTVSRHANFEVDFSAGDPANPRNWTLWYRIWTLLGVSYSTWVVVFHSTAYTASIPGLREEFGTNTTVATLGVTTYLMGLATGSLIMAPASELWGRQPVYLGCQLIFTLLVIPCAMATSLQQIIVIRFLG